MTLEVSKDMIRRQLTLLGSWTFSKHGQADCARFVVEHEIDVEPLFTHRFKLDQAEAAYHRAQDAFLRRLHRSRSSAPSSPGSLWRNIRGDH